MSYIFQILRSKLDTRTLLSMYALSGSKYAYLLTEAERRLNRKLYSLIDNLEIRDASIFLQCRHDKSCSAGCHVVTYNLNIHTDLTYMQMRLFCYKNVYNIVIQEVITRCHTDLDNALQKVSDMFVELHMYPTVTYKSDKCKTTIISNGGSLNMTGDTYSASYSANKMHGVLALTL